VSSVVGIVQLVLQLLKCEDTNCISISFIIWTKPTQSDAGDEKKTENVLLNIMLLVDGIAPHWIGLHQICCHNKIHNRLEYYVTGILYIYM